MPKVKLGRDPVKDKQEQLRETTEKIIRRAMVEQHVRDIQQAADLVGLHRTTLSAKLRHGSWTQADLVLLVSALRIPAVEAVQLLGVKL